MKIAIAILVGPADDYEVLREAGHDIVFSPTRSEGVLRLTIDELVELAGDADGLVYNVVTPEILAALPQLKFVVSPYVGYDKVNIAAATDAGVLVVNTQTEGNTAGMAEATLTLMLAAAKKLPQRAARLRDGGWRDDGTERSLLFHGGTVGIVGFGAIGQSVARHLGGWGARLLAHTRTPRPDVARELGVELVDMPTLLAESDVVTLHVPLEASTRHLIGEPELRQMKSSAVLINTSRGAVVDGEALVRAINEDWIAGAALDVFDPEPLPEDHPLRALDPARVLMTPHSMSNTPAGRRGTQREVVDNILNAASGKAPRTALNPQVWA
jgi:phosphoglycerate dehydrogenase-like enzyme